MLQVKPLAPLGLCPVGPFSNPSMTVLSDFSQVFLLCECLQEMPGGPLHSPNVKTHTHLLPYCTLQRHHQALSSLFSIITACQVMQEKVCATTLNISELGNSFVRCSCCLWKVDKVAITFFFFLPQVYEFMGNKRKCRFSRQLGYKTNTLSSGCSYSWTSAVWGRCVWSAASWRLNTGCSDYIKPGCVCESSPPSEDRWEVCVVCLCVCV